MYHCIIQYLILFVLTFCTIYILSFTLNLTSVLCYIKKKSTKWRFEDLKYFYSIATSFISLLLQTTLTNEKKKMKIFICNSIYFSSHLALVGDLLNLTLKGHMSSMLFKREYWFSILWNICSLSSWLPLTVQIREASPKMCCLSDYMFLFLHVLFWMWFTIALNIHFMHM